MPQESPFRGRGLHSRLDILPEAVDRARRRSQVDLVAYVDESESRQDLDSGTYILCATIVRASEVADLRAHMASLRPPSRKKLHWHDDNDHRSRARLVSHVADGRTTHLVVIRSGGDDTRSERRRRLCLERLTYELHGLGVKRVVFESRGPADRLDLDFLQGLRARHVVDSSIRFDHEPGPAEPLLWIADIVCGAVTQDRIGNATVLDPIRASITFCEAAPG
jgi:hypothetical protein